MQTLKKLIRGSASFFFKLLILLTAIVGALVLTFNSPKKIEKSLSDSGVYSTFVNNALQEAKKSAEKNPENGDIPIDNPAIVAAANKAFNPQLLQSSSENLLNGVYAWLQGKTTLPQFSIDLTQAKQTFAVGVGQAAYDRLAGLPTCTKAQLVKLNRSDIDPFTVPCRPPGINLKAQQAKATHDLATSKDFLGKPAITAYNLPKNDQGKTVFDQLAKLPKIYKWVNASPWLLAGLAAIAGVITLVLYDSKRRGLRNLAITLGVTGTVLILFGLASNWGLKRATQPSGALAKAIKGNFQQTAVKGLNSLGNSINKSLIMFALAYLILAIVILLGVRFIKPRKVGAEPADKKEPTPPIDDSPKQKLPKPDAPKPTK